MVSAQFAQRLDFDLTDALLRHRKPLTDFFESASNAVVKSVAHPDDLLFAGR